MIERSILYAEDDPTVRENYALILRTFFEVIHTASDGEEALRIYHERCPDAMLLDLNLPRMDGLDLARTVRREDPGIPIVILTAHSEKERLLEAIPLGLKRYLLKPVSEKEFRESMLEILKLLDHRRRIVFRERELSWDLGTQELLYREERIKLSKKERRLLALLADRPGSFIEKERLIAEIWEGESVDASHSGKLAQLVYRLHGKLSEQLGREVAPIENSYSLGYRILTL